MKFTLKILFGLAAIGLFNCGQEQVRPNILLIVSDDQGFGDLASHGNSLVETPVLDRLASNSARFNRFYVSPLCAPTRASVLTGRYHLRTGVVSVSKGLEVMNVKEITLAEALKANGHDAEALYAAQRLREFRRPDAQEWFKDCGEPSPPWQCNERPVKLEWRDLRP